MDCSDTLELRQGADVVVDAPGVDFKNVTVQAASGDDLTAMVERDDAGRVSVRVGARHGAIPGDSFAGKKRDVTITELIPGHEPFVRVLHFIVSFIVVAPVGDDLSAGTFSKPFATFHAAAAVAAKDDTILVRAPRSEAETKTQSLDNTPATLLSGVIVRCPDDALASLAMTITIDGDASFESIAFDGPRVRITQPNSTVTFSNDKLNHGLTIDSSAGVSEMYKLQRVKVDLTNNTQVLDDRVSNSPSAPAEAPLLVAANFAEVTIDSGGVKVTDERATTVEAIRVAADDATLTISGAAEFANAAGAPALNVTGASTVNVTGSRFTAPVTVSNSEADLVAQSSSFDTSGSYLSAPVTFHGRDLTFGDNSRLTSAPIIFGGRTLQITDTTIDGSKLALTPGQAIVRVEPGDSAMHVDTVTFKAAPLSFYGGALTIQGLTTFTDSQLSFEGKTLSVTDAVFVRQGILQESSDSTATLRNVQITGYTQWGYRLRGGALDIAHSLFERDLSIPSSPDGKSPPWALRVDATSDSGARLTSQAMSYDGVDDFMPGTCLPACAEVATCEVVCADTAWCGNVFAISPGIPARFSL